MENFYGFDDDMFSGSQKVAFHSFKNGEHKFRILPPYAKGKLFLQVDLHWGFTDANGGKKALKCTKWSHKTCAICDEVDRIKAEVELLKTQPATTPEAVEAKNQLIAEKEKRVSDIKKKPTYLWNILTENGEQKVLQLSWNGHDPLAQKVKFFWEQRKINVTDPRQNYLIWCSRTGQNAKTRYQYEVIEQNVVAVTLTKPLVDLGKVYKDTTPQELAAVVSQGFVDVPESDPNERDFSASMPTMEQHQQAAAPAQQQQVNTGGNPSPAGLNTTATAPALNQQQTVQPTYQSPAPTQQQTAPATLNQSAQSIAEDETEKLMRQLQM